MACFSFNVNSEGGQRRGLKGAEAVQGARLSSVTLGGQGRDVEGAKEALGRAQVRSPQSGSRATSTSVYPFVHFVLFLFGLAFSRCALSST